MDGEDGLRGRPVGAVQRQRPAEPRAARGAGSRDGRRAARHSASRSACTRPAVRRRPLLRDRRTRCGPVKGKVSSIGSATITRWPRAPREASEATSSRRIFGAGSRKSPIRTASVSGASGDGSGRPRRLAAVGEHAPRRASRRWPGSPRAGPADQADALAAAHQEVGEREGEHERALDLGRLRRGRRRSPSTASGRPTARRSAPHPIRARGHRGGRRGPSGASRPAPRPRRR